MRWVQSKLSRLLLKFCIYFSKILLNTVIGIYNEYIMYFLGVKNKIFKHSCDSQKRLHYMGLVSYSKVSLLTPEKNALYQLDTMLIIFNVSSWFERENIQKLKGMFHCTVFCCNTEDRRMFSLTLKFQWEGRTHTFRVVVLTAAVFEKTQKYSFRMHKYLVKISR
jgi:hypothetical protein